jgi:magnesium-transporting ATPase (P-type)
MIKKLGFIVTRTKNNYTMFESNGELHTYPIIGVNKFSEERKRMSIIVRHNRGENESLLLCKDYDLSILNYIKKENGDSRNQNDKISN